jgi:glycerol uptake facilitator-like aquaporin
VLASDRRHRRVGPPLCHRKRTADFDVAKGFAANGYGSDSPGKYSLAACLVAELVLTMMFLFIIMGSTNGKAPGSFAPIAIGLGLTLVHLISIPITNTSVNPARSTGPALFVGGWALSCCCSGWRHWLAEHLAVTLTAGSAKNRLPRLQGTERLAVKKQTLKE